VRSLLRRLLGLALLGGIGYGVWRVWQARQSEQWPSDDTASWPSAPAPEAAPATATEAPSGNGEATSGSSSPAEAPGNGQATATPEASGESAGESAAGKEAAAGGRARSSPRPKTGPARKAPTGKAAEPPGERMWVAASNGVCPPSHPIKAKLSSKIFHAPGARNYGRTHADRCYPDEQSAEADGLRPALR
jgi:hypothetical protein